MGTDIHMLAEVKVKDEWKAVGAVFAADYYYKDQPTTVTRFSDGEIWTSNELLTTEPYHGRNYNLFAILADVRNGHGFAGVKTGKGFNPIAEPRGLPEDISNYAANELEESADHSHSHIYLAELLNYNWDQETTHYGTVDAKQYIHWRNNGKPDSWCGSVMGGGVQNVSNEYMESLIKNTDFEFEYDWNSGKPHYYTQIEWTEPYRDSVGDFLTVTVPKLQEISNLNGVEDVRIVFGFDSQEVLCLGKIHCMKMLEYIY